MVTPVFHADVAPDGSRLLFDDRESYRRRGYLKQLAGQRVEIVVRKHRKTRSSDQNRYWWGVAIPLLAHELGYDRHEHEMVHYAVVAKCFGTRFDEKLKQDVPNVRSSKLTTAQFSELMEWVVRWAATEFGIEIPLPNEAR